MHNGLPSVVSVLRQRHCRQSQPECRAWRPVLTSCSDVAEQIRGRTSSGHQKEIQDTMSVVIFVPAGSGGYGIPVTSISGLAAAGCVHRASRCTHFLVLVRCNVMRLCNDRKSDFYAVISLLNCLQRSFRVNL